MKKNQPFLPYLFAFINVWGAVLHAPEKAGGQTSQVNGIQPLVQLEEQSLHPMIPPHVRPLLTAQEQVRFLQELEGLPPEWHTLRNSDHRVQSERLFELNRERDEARLVHKSLLQQSIAFVWSGILRKYMAEYQGFSVALGPELTYTSWGIVRFKPMGLPDYLVAIPPPETSSQLRIQQQHGEQREIIVLFIGTLIADESLMYGFSHDGEEHGMILPVVQIEGIKYFLKPL